MSDTIMEKANSRTSNTRGLLESLGGIALLLAMMTLQSCSKAEAGPNGGDVVPLNGQTKAEVVANSETGEVMVHTWNQNLKTSQPIEAKPLVIGSGDQTVELQPHRFLQPVLRASGLGTRRRSTSGLDGRGGPKPT